MLAAKLVRRTVASANAEESAANLAIAVDQRDCMRPIPVPFVSASTL